MNEAIAESYVYVYLFWKRDFVENRLVLYSKQQQIKNKEVMYIWNCLIMRERIDTRVLLILPVG